MNDTDPQAMHELVDRELANFELPKGDEIDMEQRARDYAREAIMRTRRAYWHHATPSAYRAPDSTPENPRHNFNVDHPTIQANRAALETVLGWKFGRQGILASGKTSRGKTRAMYALCHRLACEEGIDVAIWPAQEFFAALQAEVRYQRDDAAEFIRRQAQRPVLFIDDYGQEALLQSRAEWSQGWFFRLIDRRMENGLPLLMTTNMNAKQMLAKEDKIGGDPFIRRLLEVATPLKFA